ncbi:MAG: MBL fold metallo-hydrolase [Lentisphaeria bacterium]|nr:MBL fold metallo-hydrolase [Lentisphaeria bacterium]
MTTKVLFTGTATVVPGAGQDTACLLVNQDCLFDTGWNAAVNMQQYDCNPLDVRLLFITHCHHDHYIGLPQLLFLHAMKGKPRLTIVGPKPDIHMIVERACRFLRDDQFRDIINPPEIHALQAGQTYEDDVYEVTTAPTVHPVVGLCYRLRDKRTGSTMAVTGDTAYHEPLARHVAGVDLLVHEASRGAVESDPLAVGGHSGSIDAARIAAAAKVEKLALTHYPRVKRAEILAAAEAVFPNTMAAVEGDLLEL